jgi:hypothetical protein
MLAKFMEEKGGDPPKRGPGRPPKTEQAAA